jgi:hypothetical protein
MQIDSRLKAIRLARIAYEEARDELERYHWRYGYPRGISGEKMTREQRIEEKRLSDACHDASVAYIALKAR